MIGESLKAERLLEQALTIETGQRNLSKAVQQSRNVALLTDLAAAYLSAAVTTDGPNRRLNALDTIERAHELAPHQPETAWNRALAFTALRRLDLARDAWKDAADKEPNASWRYEAMRRLEETPEPARQSPSDIAAMLQVLEKRDVARLEQLIRSNPQNAFAAADQILHNWSAAAGSAENELELLGLLGRAIQTALGDDLIADTSASIATQPRSSGLRYGIAEYCEGRRLYLERRNAEAIPHLEKATDVLGPLQVPIEIRGRIHLATIDFYDGRLERALDRLDAIRRRIGTKRYPMLLAHTDWTEGLLQGAKRFFSKANAAYSRALARLTTIGDVVAQSWMETMLAENERFAGSLDASWARIERSLALYNRTDDAGRRCLTLTEAARTAQSAGKLFAARSFCDEAHALAIALAKPGETADTLLVRASILMDLNRPAEGLPALEEVSAKASLIPDPIERNRFAIDADLMRGQLLAEINPAETVARLDRAISVLQQQGKHLKLARGFDSRARAQLRLGDVKSAEWDLRAGLSEVELQRHRIEDEETRVELLEVGRNLTDGLVRLLISEDRCEEAFDVGERIHARVLLDTIAGGDSEEQFTEPLSWQALRRKIPREVSFLATYFLPDRLLLWVAGRDSLECRQVFVNRDAATSLVDALDSGKDAPLQQLHALLIEPVASLIRPRNTVVIVPDRELNRIPFAALHAPNGPYLIEDHPIIIAPGVNWAIRRRNRESASLERMTGIVVAAPRGNVTAGLPYLAAAETEAALVMRLLPGTQLIDGQTDSRAAFLEKASSAPIIHYAGHAIVDETRPGQSSLLLDEGAVTASTIRGLDLHRTQLVVLGACSTASGRMTSDGAMSLARSFALAGASSIVATLWPIEDAGTAPIIADFYSALMSSRKVHEALRDAQLKVIATPGNSTWKQWAAYEVIGVP